MKVQRRENYHELHEIKIALNSEFFVKYQSESKLRFSTTSPFHLSDWHSTWNEQEMCNV